MFLALVSAGLRAWAYPAVLFNPTNGAIIAPTNLVMNGLNAQTTNSVNFTKVAFSFTTPQFYAFACPEFPGSNLSKQGVYFTIGTNPLVLPTQTNSTSYYVPMTNSSISSVDCPQIHRYLSNGVPVEYVLSCQVNAGSDSAVVGFSTSFDLTNWTSMVFNQLYGGNQQNQQWSPHIFEGPTNDLHYLFGGYYNNNRVIWCADVNITNLALFSNPRPLFLTNYATMSGGGGGDALYSNGVYYVYNTSGGSGGVNQVYTNNALTSGGWQLASTNCGYGSAPSIVNYSGSNYMFNAFGAWLSPFTNYLLQTGPPISVPTSYATEGGLVEIGIYSNLGYTVTSTNTNNLTAVMPSPFAVASLSADSISANAAGFDALLASSALIGSAAIQSIGTGTIYDPGLGNAWALYNYPIAGDIQVGGANTNLGPYVLFDGGNTGNLLMGSAGGSPQLTLDGDVTGNAIFDAPVQATSFIGFGGNLTGVLTNAYYTNLSTVKVSANGQLAIGTNAFSGGGGAIPNGLVTNAAPASITVVGSGVTNTINTNAVTAGYFTYTGANWTVLATNAIALVTNVVSGGHGGLFWCTFSTTAATQQSMSNYITFTNAAYCPSTNAIVPFGLTDYGTNVPTGTASLVIKFCVIANPASPSNSVILYCKAAPVTSQAMGAAWINATEIGNQ